VVVRNECWVVRLPPEGPVPPLHKSLLFALDKSCIICLTATIVPAMKPANPTNVMRKFLTRTHRGKPRGLKQ